MKYTVEEVRAIAKRLHDDITVADGDALMASDMLTELAERIEADEGAAAIWQYRHADDVQWSDCDELDADAWKQTGLHEVRKLFPYPPAQAAQVDPAWWVWRREGAHPPAQVEPTEAVISKAVEVFLDAAPEWNDYLVKDGMRAALLAVWPTTTNHSETGSKLADAELYKSACDSAEEWKARALKAERIAEQLGDALNDMTGPTFMGEPVLSKPVAQGKASLGRCKACGRATRSVCDGLDGNGLGCTNAQPIDLAAVRKVIANHRSEAAKLSHDPESRDYLCEQADKLEAALQEKGNG